MKRWFLLSLALCACSSTGASDVEDVEGVDTSEQSLKAENVGALPQPQPVRNDINCGKHGTQPCWAGPPCPRAPEGAVLSYYDDNIRLCTVCGGPEQPCCVAPYPKGWPPDPLTGCFRGAACEFNKEWGISRCSKKYDKSTKPQSESVKPVPVGESGNPERAKMVFKPW